ncbi:MAG: 6-carboxytetrahydropterin synthase [Halomonas sp.]|jgi:6-pyruvoyl-tetrahydropterin synthase|uniref:6-carboxy-5,6,7,8-tetrahydropterin synthase n=1 Tax=Billgrantia tianxiuensis TaxID=2497861 RepID=A0A6I6SL41_9GAMM|nr:MULTISPECIES: 6-carboxytetrahydropterin synthase [Halomonas]MCE8031940.1 6-pyruvoyl tetrahydropterin synthase-related protein [Halomonas sp. MCCC 1A11057]MDX5435072.1 6-carboxytetrahydropterin synthase [Halomonas sp.]QHC49991.1 6-pyruvoyl tetrahydropterin synthase-related protein [Halomonas tianxiuensis]
MTLFVNRLTQLDASLWCPQRGLTGVSWFVDAELDGELGEDGMLFDFGEVKPWIKSRLDAGADHTLLVPIRAPGVTTSECSEGLCVRTTAPYAMEVRAPRQAFTLLPWTEVTPDRLAERLARELMKRPPPRVSDIRLRLRTETIDGAAYTYSHGLKHHAGNCQRIAHGHRSRLHVWQRGQRCPELEAQWADFLNDRYLVDKSDIVRQVEPEIRPSLTSRYRAGQGRFHIRLPLERCIVMNVPSTIEHIAAWLAQQIAEETGKTTRVQAFEGIDKGAIAEAKP